MVIHADGFGTTAGKLGAYARLAIPSPPFHTGFKLLYRQGTPLMRPGQVMALHPRPDVIAYE